MPDSKLRVQTTVSRYRGIVRILGTTSSEVDQNSAEGGEQMEAQGKGFKKKGKGFYCTLILVSLIASPCFSTEDPSKFPSKPITLVVQFAAGGVADLTGRKLADSAGKVLGQPVVVVSKVGGGGVIGATAVAKADPDGYTIGVISWSAPVIIPHQRSVPYNTKEDFTWIMEYAELSQIFCVQTESRWKTFKDLIDDARKNPGKLNYASPSPLGGQHILMEQVFAMEKVKLNHVPVGGGAEVVTKLLGGHIDAGIAAETPSQVKAGRFRGLVVQGERRLDSFPDIPTFFALGYKVEAPLWIGLCAPKGVDPRIVKKLHDAFKSAYDEPSFKELLSTLYCTAIYRDSESFKTLVLNDFDAQGRVLKELGFAK
jgi:tripartite-type tricarboxylate transporter receptor subunit TctC